MVFDNETTRCTEVCRFAEAQRKNEALCMKGVQYMDGTCRFTEYHQSSCQPRCVRTRFQDTKRM